MVSHESDRMFTISYSHRGRRSTNAWPADSVLERGTPDPVSAPAEWSLRSIVMGTGEQVDVSWSGVMLPARPFTHSDAVASQAMCKDHYAYTSSCFRANTSAPNLQFKIVQNQKHYWSVWHCNCSQAHAYPRHSEALRRLRRLAAVCSKR